MDHRFGGGGRREAKPLGQGCHAHNQFLDGPLTWQHIRIKAPTQNSAFAFPQENRRDDSKTVFGLYRREKSSFGQSLGRSHDAMHPGHLSFLGGAYKHVYQNPTSQTSREAKNAPFPPSFARAISRASCEVKNVPPFAPSKLRSEERPPFCPEQVAK
jgi:hypothetical protein